MPVNCSEVFLSSNDIASNWDQDWNAIVLAILEHLELKNFHCRPTVVAYVKHISSNSSHWNALCRSCDSVFQCGRWIPSVKLKVLIKILIFKGCLPRLIVKRFGAILPSSYMHLQRDFEAEMALKGEVLSSLEHIRGFVVST